jgi:hypothetical protein
LLSVLKFAKRVDHSVLVTQREENGNPVWGDDVLTGFPAKCDCPTVDTYIKPSGCTPEVHTNPICQLHLNTIGEKKKV